MLGVLSHGAMKPVGRARECEDMTAGGLGSRRAWSI
jgi:hypothetical protein